MSWSRQFLEKSAWQYSFAKNYFEQGSRYMGTGQDPDDYYLELDDQLRELFKVEYVIGELKRRGYLNGRLAFSRRYNHWLQKLQEHALGLATEQVGPRVLNTLDSWLNTHSSSGWAESAVGAEDDYSLIPDDGIFEMGEGFTFEIGGNVIEYFLKMNPKFVNMMFAEDWDYEDRLQEHTELTGEDPRNWNAAQQFEYVKDQIESFGYSFQQLRSWLNDFGDFDQAILSVLKTDAYPAWRTWWGDSIEVAEENVQGAADRLRQALESQELGPIFAAISLALNAQHVHGGMFEHMDLDESLLEELSNLDTNELDEFVGMVTGDWEGTKEAQYAPNKVPKFYHDEFEVVISDVDRYTADKYWITVQILESLYKYSIGLNIINSHVGICGQGQYWHFEKNELSKAKKTYAEVKKIVQELHNEIEYVRPPMAIIAPMFRSAMHYVDYPHRERSGVYHHNWFEELPKVADWRCSLYGKRYPHPPTATQRMGDFLVNIDEHSKNVVFEGNSRQRKAHYKQAARNPWVREDGDWMKPQPSPYGLDYKPPESTLGLATFIGKHWKWTIPAATTFLIWFASIGGDHHQLMQDVQNGATPAEVLHQVQPENMNDQAFENAPEPAFEPEVPETPSNQLNPVDSTPQPDTMNMPRGIRNNNPGNIRITDTQWQGLSEDQADESFFTFETPEHGIRVMARVLRNYQRRHSLKTLNEIIGRWAPASENDTTSYVEHVSQQLGISPDSPIDLEDDGILVRLIQVMIRHENGGDFIDGGTIQNGVLLEKSGSSDQIYRYSYQISDKFDARARMYAIMRQLKTTDWNTIVQALIQEGVGGEDSNYRRNLFSWLNQQWITSLAQSSWNHKYVLA